MNEAMVIGRGTTCSTVVDRFAMTRVSIIDYENLNFKSHKKWLVDIVATSIHSIECIIKPLDVVKIRMTITIFQVFA